MTEFHPGSFPVGSAISRAAARALIEDRRAQSKRVDTVICRDGQAAPSFGEWEENSDGCFSRYSSIPAGVTFAEAEAAAGLAPTRTDGDYLLIILLDRIRTKRSRQDLEPEW